MSTPPSQSHPTEDEKRECFKKEFEAIATAYIFERRMNSAGSKLKALSYATFVIPIAVAALLTTWDNVAFGSYVKIGSGIVSGVVALFGLWAALANWPSILSESARSMVANDQLQRSWKYVTALKEEEFTLEFAKLIALDAQQESNDKAKGVSAAERRRGNRKALYDLGKPCATCKKQPSTLKAAGSKCQTCGDY
jgi:mobilome CxxCx(11)CxxC protein